MKNKHLKVLWLTAMLASPVVFANCNSAVTPTTPDSRFIINNDGTVTDKQTGLIWMRCSLGQTWDGTSCNGSASTMSWQGALQAAKSSSFAGFTNWRLPNIKELSSIVELACDNPAINTTIFPNTPPVWFWSSSPSAYSSNFAWYVVFGSGDDYDDNKNNGEQVRLVRTGQ